MVTSTYHFEANIGDERNTGIRCVLAENFITYTVLIRSEMVITAFDKGLHKYKFS